MGFRETLFQNRNGLITVLSIINLIFWFKVLKPTTFEMSTLLLLIAFSLNSLVTKGCFMKKKDMAMMVFYFWIIRFIFETAGMVFGTIGIIIAMLVITIRLVVRALTSTYYKDMTKNLSKEIRSWRGK